MQACDHRVAYTDTDLLIHPGCTWAPEGTFVYNFIAKGEYEKRILDRMYKIYYNAMKETKGDDLKKGLKAITNMFSKDVYLSAEDALKWGLLDEVI